MNFCENSILNYKRNEYLMRKKFKFKNSKYLFNTYMNNKKYILDK